MSARPDVELIAGADDARIAGWIAARLGAALAASEGTVAISLPGGSTPFPILAELVKHPLVWERVVAFPGDDRLVPEDHPASNTGKLRALLEPAGASVRALFPNTDPRSDDPAPVRRLTPDPLPPEAPFDRITLTIPALLACEALMFVIRGDDKRAVLEGALAGGHDLPIARLLAARGDTPVTCFV